MKKNLKILVVDDMKVIAENMQSIIAGNENVEKVHIALDGEDAFIQILNFQPDLVFTDNQMPKRTGIELIEYIKEFPNLEKKPQFILVTGDRGIELIKKANELECNIEFKPITNEKINYYIDNFEPFIENKEEINIKINEKKLEKSSLLKRLLKK